MTRSHQIFRSAVLLLAAVAAAGCSASEPTGGVEIAWNVGGGVTLTSATYYILAPNGAVTSGTVAVGNSPKVAVAVGTLPAGSGYTLIASGVASDGTTGCSGTASFTVTGASTNVVVVQLACGDPGSPGQALVVGSLNVCPLIDGVSATPSSAGVGATIGLEVIAHDPDGGPAALLTTWSATGGALSATTGAAPALTCTAPGTVRVTVTASDGDATCADRLSFDVTCTEP
jgi:hypothetical protein